MLKDSWNKFLFVLVIASISGILAIFHVIIGYAKTPPGMIYMATGHYFLDYFEYVQTISQGMWGRWLVENPFATDDLEVSFFGRWQYLIFGKIGKIFHLTPIATHWLANALFSAILAILIFKAMQKLLPKESFKIQFSGYLLVLFAAPFWRLVKEASGYRIDMFGFWNDKAVFFDRFESVPYHLSATILTLLVLLLSDFEGNSKRSTLISTIIKPVSVIAIMLFLLTFSPANALLLFVALCLSYGFVGVRSLIGRDKKSLIYSLLFLFLLVITILPTGVVIKNYLTGTYYASISKIEATWQIKPSWREVFLTTGPILFLCLIGIRDFVKKITLSRILFLTFLLTSYIFFLSPLAVFLGTTNSRFLTPLNYTTFGAVGALGVSRFKYVGIITIIFLLFSLPSNWSAFRSLLTDPHISTPITYLPKGIISGFQFLDKYPKKGNVLTSPRQFLGIVLPIYTDRRVYVVRPHTTPNYVEKNIISERFFLGLLPESEAKDLMLKNGLRFAVIASIEGYQNANISKSYPFLQEIYRNRDVVIFEVKKV